MLLFLGLRSLRVSIWDLSGFFRQFLEGFFSETSFPAVGVLGDYLCGVGFASVLQRPDVGVDPHDHGIQRDLQVVRFFRGAQALIERAGLVQLRLGYLGFRRRSRQAELSQRRAVRARPHRRVNRSLGSLKLPSLYG